MINTELIAKHLKIDQGKEQGFCKMCGRKTENGCKAKDVIKDARFTNFDELKNIQSDVVCEFCACCMKEPAIRRSSFIADNEKIIYLKKNDIENYIFDLKNIVSGEFVVCITKSFKKHLSFKAEVNINPLKFSVQEEDIRYTLDAVRMKEIYAILNEMYMYFSKDELLTGNYEPLFIRDYVNEYGENKFFENENKLSEVRGSKAYDLCIHILNSERKNELIKERKKCKK